MSASKVPSFQLMLDLRVSNHDKHDKPKLCCPRREMTHLVIAFWVRGCQLIVDYKYVCDQFELCVDWLHNMGVVQAVSVRAAGVDVVL
ncbi:MAG: hypothetical protein ACR2NF_08165 [Pirellulales bacterium]